MELLEASKRSSQVIDSSDRMRMTADIERYQAKIKELEERINHAHSEVEEENDDKLSSLVESHKKIMDKLNNEQSTIVNLMLRIHFKKQLHERNEMVTISKSDVEKSSMKTAKAVESLEKKLERKEARKEELLLAPALT